jgi:serine/threonine-protein kinase
MIRLQVLGTLSLVIDGKGDGGDVLAHAKRVALLSYLLLAQPRGFHRRDRLYALLWPEADTERARNSLRQAVHQLRRTLGTDAVLNRGDEEIGLAPDLFFCDALALENAVADGSVSEAVGLYGGELLSSFHVPGAREFTEWLETERVRLRDLATQAAWTHAEDLARAGDPAEASRVARRAASWQPLDELNHRRLIEMLDQLGDAAGALRAYDAFAERLRTELDVEPSEQTASVVRAIRERSPVLPPPPTWAVPSPREAAETRRGWGSGALYAAGVLTALVIAGVWQSGRRPPEPPPDPSRVMVFPFTIRGAAELSYLGAGMVDLLSAKLEGASGLHAIDPRSVISAMARLPDSLPPDLPALANLARGLGAGRFILGDLTQAGSQIQLSAALHDVGAEHEVNASVLGVASGDGVFDMVDGLSGRLLAGLTTGPDTALTRIAAVTTTSLPALKMFLEGEQDLRAGRDIRAAQAYREATRLDSTFALAQYRLALVATWVSLPDVPDPAERAVLAARYAQRLTPLVRDLVTAYQAYKEVRIEDAERIYRAVTEAHPDNVEAWFMLGETWFHYNPLRGRSPMESRAAFRKVLELDPSNTHATIHLARLAAADGRFEELDSLSTGYFAQHGEAERALEMRALVAYSHDDPPGMAAIAKEVNDADEYVLMSVLQAAVHYAHNFDAGADLAHRYTAPVAGRTSRVYGHRVLTQLPLAGGRLERDVAVRLLGNALDSDWLLESEALFAADPVFPVSKGWIAAVRDSVAARRNYPTLLSTLPSPEPKYGSLMQTYLLGLLSVRLGDSVGVVKALAGLADTHDPRFSSAASNLAIGLRAEVARSRGDLAGALRELDHLAWDFGVPLLDRPVRWAMHERFLRAELLHQLRRDPEALALYESFTGSYDLTYMAVAQLRQGEIYEHMKQKGPAAFHYGRFVGMWKDCDPELRPLLLHAKEALERVR